MATAAYNFIGFGDIHGPKAYKFIGFGGIHGTKAYNFVRFGDGPKAYKFIGFGDGPKAYKFIGFGDIHGTKSYKFIGFGDIHERILFGRNSKSALPPAEGPILKLSRSASDRDPARKTDFRSIGLLGHFWGLGHL